MRVLVVEDEPRLAAAIALGLEDHGFAVEVVHEGHDAWHLAREDAFDAIVLDLLLPGLNGYEVLRRIRADGVTTPVLVLTAKEGEYDEADALDLGADDYLRKPFAWVVLVARINALLRRGPTEQAPVLQVGDLVLDPGSRQAVRDGQPLDLTPREFSLLECLMRRPGQAWTKRQLLDHVWGADWDRDVNVVEVYVGYLRRKVDRPFGAPMIETVRGHGYRVVDVDA